MAGKSNENLIEEINRIKNTPGYVYLMRNKDLYKIGITMSIERRIKQLKPDEIIEIAQIPNIRGTERLLHKRFKERRVPQTEYFRLTTEEVEEVRHLFKSIRGDSLRVITPQWAEEGRSLKAASLAKPKVDYSQASTEWIKIIRGIQQSFDYQEMLWAEATTSTGKVITGSYYILNVSDEECLLPRSDDLIQAVMRLESEDDYLLPVAKAESQQDAAECGMRLVGDLLLTLCWGYWQGLFQLELGVGDSSRAFIERSEEFLREQNRWYTTESPTRRKRLEKLRGWATQRKKLFGIF